MNNKKDKNKKNEKSKVKNKKKSNNSSDNVIKMKTSFDSKNMIQTKKLRVSLVAIILIFVLLICRIGFLQFVEGSTLKEAAYNQQAINQIISPKRGNIYDSTGRSLAISAQVDTITINPAKIAKENGWREVLEGKKASFVHFCFYFLFAYATFLVPPAYS